MDDGEYCNDCSPPWVRSRLSTPRLLISFLPFLITFSAIFLAVLHRLFPVLCASNSRCINAEGRLRKRLAALTFSATFGATGVLGELILCEIGDWVETDARRQAFRIVDTVLLLCLVLAIPALELHFLVQCLGVDRWPRKYAVTLESICYGIYLVGFWSVGNILPTRISDVSSSRTLSEECLGRIGIIGVSLMALLSGTCCVSNPWHSFTWRPREVTESDVARARAGLDATREMLEGKWRKLYALERKIQDKKASQEGLMSKVLTTIRGDADSQEHVLLVKETNGLKTMQASLIAEAGDLEHRLAGQRRAKTLFGRIFGTVQYVFGVYCLYRLGATTFAHLPITHRHTSFSQTDPITNILSLVAKHWDPHLDRAAWSSQISFALSGILILGSFGSVMTTINMLTRAVPGLVGPAVQGDNPNLALFVSQISALYVVASSLLLRSSLPLHLSSVITESLGAPLDPAFVDRMFDYLFLFAAGLTTTSLLLGRKWALDRDLEELELMETGKRL